MLVITLGLPLSALAGPEAGDRELTLSASGNNSNNFDSGGFGIAGSLGYFLTDNTEIALRHNMIFFDSDQVNSNYAASTRAAIDYHFGQDPWRFFVGLNLGARYGDGAVDETGIAAPEAGVKLYVKDKTFITAMAEYQFFFKEANDVDNNFDDGQFVYTIGIGFNF